MHITWDPEKSRSNKAKHGLSFELAQEVFRDPLHASRRIALRMAKFVGNRLVWFAALS